MAVVKVSFVKRGRGEKARVKATIRYIQHRPGKDGEKVTRTLFDSDGVMDRKQAYYMIDEAKRGTIFFRIIISPDPRREDSMRDLDLWAITTNTMQALEERLKKEVQWLAVEHNDHTSVRHIHAVVLLRGKLNRADFQALRQSATEAALFQRRERDLALGVQQRQRTGRPTRLRAVRMARGHRWEPQAKPLLTLKTCFSCGVLQTVSRREVQKCRSCGARLSKQRGLSAGYEEAQWG